MRRVILTLLAVVVVLWLLVPRKAPAPLPEASSSEVATEVAAAQPPASSVVAETARRVPVADPAPSLPLPEGAAASAPVKKTDVGQQLREELKGVLGGGGGSAGSLSKYNPFDY